MEFSTTAVNENSKNVLPGTEKNSKRNICPTNMTKFCLLLFLRRVPRNPAITAVNTNSTREMTACLEITGYCGFGEEAVKSKRDTKGNHIDLRTNNFSIVTKFLRDNIPFPSDMHGIHSPQPGNFEKRGMKKVLGAVHCTKD